MEFPPLEAALGIIDDLLNDSGVEKRFASVKSHSKFFEGSTFNQGIDIVDAFLGRLKRHITGCQSTLVYVIPVVYTIGTPEIAVGGNLENQLRQFVNPLFQDFFIYFDILDRNFPKLCILQIDFFYGWRNHLVVIDHI
jgi:hypothetical protein